MTLKVNPVTLTSYGQVPMVLEGSGACGAGGTGTWAVLSSIPEGACACGAEEHMASIGPPALGAKGCVERLHRFAQGAADWRSGKR